MARTYAELTNSEVDRIEELDNLSGNANKVLTVKSDETGVEYTTNGSGDVSASGTLTADTIILGNGTTSIKSSAKTIVTTIGNDDTSLPTSLAVKDYADNLFAGVKWKDEAELATTANITLSGEQTIDGVLTSASRVLVKDQTNQTENGIYITGAGAWTRATDADTGTEIVASTLKILSGSTYANYVFINTNSSITLGVTNITYVSFGSIISHNNTTGKQGGTTNEYYHLTSDEYTNLVVTSDLVDENITAAASATNYTPTASTVEGHLAGIDTALGLNPTESFVIAISDETTAITTGTAKVTFRMPYAFTLTAVRASLTTASSSGTPTFDINEGGTTILSTKITIDANETTSTTATTAPVISDSSLADDAEITIDIDVAGTGATGAKIYLIGNRT